MKNVDKKDRCSNCRNDLVAITCGIPIVKMIKRFNSKESYNSDNVEDHIEKKMTGDVATFNMTKEDLLKAHKYSLKNRKQLEKDKKCGCFCCGMIFNPKRIKKWCHDGTALCPYCGTDSVIGESSGFPIDKSFLDAMEKYWF